MSDLPQDTRWSLVARTKGDTPAARAALSELCEIYYAPVHQFILRWKSPDEARDLTHEFFARVLEKNSLGNADPEKGRFRSYLFGAVKHFLAETAAREESRKRGGGRAPVAFEELFAEDPEALPPDVAFDRAWACTILEHALEKLSAEMEGKGKEKTFERLRPWLAGTAEHGDQLEVASELGISETAIRVVVHRMRRRLRELVEDEVARTLDPDEDVAAELRRLLGAW